MKITFKTGNAIELDADHASMIGPSRKRARHFKVSRGQQIDLQDSSEPLTMV
jgi:hypothetical protein